MASYRKSVVNQRELRRLIKERHGQMRMGDKVSRRLESRINAAVDEAVKKAKRQNRSTLLPRDFEDGN